jgi:dTDP-4-dehydrorhamnose reductase
MNKPKILIFGASGQVGRSFRQSFGNSPSVIFVERSPKDELTRSCDLRDVRKILNLVEAERPNIIINCAAYTAVDLAETETSVAMAINGTAVEAMAKAAEQVGAVFIHYSTDYVFNGLGDEPRDESASTDPINYYGKSKLAGDEAVIKYCTRGYVFRTQWVYDNDGKNFLNTMLRLASDRERLSIVGDQIGAPTPASVISEYTLKALVKIADGQMLPGIYNLVCRGEVSWHGFAEEIFKTSRELGVALKVQHVDKILSKDFPTPAPRPKNSRLSNLKFEGAIGQSMPTWRDALTKVLKTRGKNSD